MLRPVHGGHASDDGQIVGLGAAGGEENALGFDAQRLCDGLTAGAHRLFRINGRRVERGRIVKAFAHAPRHGLDHSLGRTGGCAVVQICLQKNLPRIS